MSQQDLANALNVAQGTVSNWENGVRGIDATMLSTLADFFGVSVDYLLGRTDDPTDYEDPDLLSNIKPEILEHCGGNPRKALIMQRAIEREAMSDPSFYEDTVPIPILGRVQAGVPVEAVEDIIGYEKIPADMAMLGKHFALQVKGDSMSPRICEGDIVIVRRQSSAENGDIVVVLVNGEDATVKRFFKSEQGITLVPLNPTYEPLFFSSSEVERLPVIVIGKVVEMRRKM